MVGTNLPVLLSTKSKKVKSHSKMTKLFQFVKSEIKEKMLRKDENIQESFLKFHLVFELAQEKVINCLKVFKLKLRPVELNIDGALIDLSRKIASYLL